MDIAAFWEENWLSILAACYLIGMMLYGHYRGFLRLAVSMAALLIALVGVRVMMPIKHHSNQITGCQHG